MRTFSDFLSMGYLYLLVLGVVSDSIYYGWVGINIMSYSTILDVLLSPVIHLTKGLVFSGLIVLILIGAYFLIRRAKREDAKKVAAGKKPDLISKQPLMTLWVGFSAWVIFAAFIGYGLGGGHKYKRHMQSADFKPNSRIVFNDDSEASVRIMGKNSGYVFYIEAGNDFVTVSPVTAVKKMEKR